MLAQMKMGRGFHIEQAATHSTGHPSNGPLGLSRAHGTGFMTQVTENSYWKPPDAAGWLIVWADFILYHSSHSDNGEPGF